MRSAIKGRLKANAKRAMKSREKKLSIMKMKKVERKEVKIDEIVNKNLTENVFENSSNTCEKSSFYAHPVNDEEGMYDSSSGFRNWGALGQILVGAYARKQKATIFLSNIIYNLNFKQCLYFLKQYILNNAYNT